MFLPRFLARDFVQLDRSISRSEGLIGSLEPAAENLRVWKTQATLSSYRERFVAAKRAGASENLTSKAFVRI